MIYDPFGIGGPGFCYDKSHGHAKPNEAWAECPFQLTLTDGQTLYLAGGAVVKGCVHAKGNS